MTRQHSSDRTHHTLGEKYKHSLKYYTLGGGGGGGLFYMPISTEGSGTPTMRPLTGGVRSQGRRILHTRGGGRNYFTCSYPLKVKARPPWDHWPALWYKVSGQEDITHYGGWTILHANIHWRFRHAHHETGNWSKVLGQEDITHYWEGKLFYMPITSVGSGMSTMRLETGLRSQGRRILHTVICLNAIKACHGYRYRPSAVPLSG